MVADSVDDGVGMQSFSKGILSGFDDTLTRRNILNEDGCSCKSEQVVFLESLDNELVHIAKLRAVAFVEYHHHLFLIDITIGVILDIAGQFLNGGNDNLTLCVAYLLLQHLR